MFQTRMTILDINFHDPGDIPLPPDEVRIRELRVEPLPDGRRVHLFIEITPFQQKPNCEIIIFSDIGHEAASLSIIEAIDYKMQFTVHLKDALPAATYTVEMEVYYFEADQSETASQDETHQLPERAQPVDQRQVEFSFADARDAG